jgi:ankyrin repeat protein
LGFLSHHQFQKHWTHFHANGIPKQIQPKKSVDKDEVLPLLFDLVSLGRVEEVRQLQDEYKQLHKWDAAKLLNLAALHGSLELFEIFSLHREINGHDLSASAVKAIQGGNLELFSHIYQHHRDVLIPTKYNYSVMRAAITSENLDIFDFCLENQLISTKPDWLFGEGTIGATVEPEHQVRLIKAWERIDIHSVSGARVWLSALRQVADTNCSVILASFILKPEWNVDPDWRMSVHERTALHIAATRDTAAAAELIKLLLVAGANPNTTQNTTRKGSRVLVSIAQEKGAKNISKWLGQTWPDLVAWARLQWTEDHEKRWNKRQKSEKMTKEKRRLAEERKVKREEKKKEKQEEGKKEEGKKEEGKEEEKIEWKKQATKDWENQAKAKSKPVLTDKEEQTKREKISKFSTDSIRFSRRDNLKSQSYTSATSCRRALFRETPSQLLATWTPWPTTSPNLKTTRTLRHLSSRAPKPTSSSRSF